MASNDITLTDGPNSGRSYFVETWQDVLYVPVPLSDEEKEDLRIDDRIAWKEPEAVYKRARIGVFLYSHTVHYKPTD